MPIQLICPFLKFLYFEKKRERESVCVCEREREREQRRGRERRKERIPSGIHTVRVEPNAGHQSTHHKIMTWVEIKSQILNQLSHPGAPHLSIFNWVVFLLLSCKSTLRVLNIRTFDIWFANIFSHYLGCLFNFLMMSFEALKFLILTKSTIFFPLLLILLESYLKIHCQIWRFISAFF